MMDNNLLLPYRISLAVKILSNKKGSLMGAVLAVSIGILVIHVNAVIFQGLFNAIVRDMVNYRFGNVYITHEKDFITKSDNVLVNWLKTLPPVRAAAPRLSSSALSVNITENGQRIEETGVPLIGVDPRWDKEASTVYQTVREGGQYVFLRNSAVIGQRVAEDLGNPPVGDGIKVAVRDKTNNLVTKRFVITGIAETPGGQGLDGNIIIHIDTLREMLDRRGETGEILVRLHDATESENVRNTFQRAFANDDFLVETLEESAEERLEGFRSGIAMINLIGIFGLMSSAFAIVTILMMLVTSKTREIGVMRAIGAKRRDVLVLFMIQGLIIGSIGAAVGTAMGMGFATYAKETNMRFAGSVALHVTYDWEKAEQAAIMAFTLAVIASLYPAYRATKLEPVEAMRIV